MSDLNIINWSRLIVVDGNDGKLLMLDRRENGIRVETETGYILLAKGTTIKLTATSMEIK